MELLTVAQASQRALSTDFRCGSLCQRRNLSEKVGNWVLDTRLRAGGLVASQTCATCRWPIALNLKHTRYISHERLKAIWRELEHGSRESNSGIAHFFLVMKREP